MPLTPEQALTNALAELNKDPLNRDPRSVKSHLDVIRGLSAPLDPSHTAQVVELSRRTRIPESVLMGLPGKRIKEMNTPSLDVGAPGSKTQRYLANTVNATVSRGDERTIAALEAGHERFMHDRDLLTGVLAREAHAWKDQERLVELQEEAGFLFGDKIIRGLAVDDVHLQDLQDEMAAISAEEQAYGPIEFVAGAVSNTANQLQAGIPSVAGGALLFGVAGTAAALVAAPVVATVGAAVGGTLGGALAITGSSFTAGAGFARGAAVGATAAVAKRAYYLESGLAAMELSQIRDDTRTPEFPHGRPIDREIVAAFSQAVGLTNSVLEAGGFGLVLKGASKILGKTSMGKRLGRQAIIDEAKELLKDSDMRARVKEAMGGLALGVGGEMATESAQEIANIIFSRGAERAATKEQGLHFEDTRTFRPGDLERVAQVALKVGVGGLGIGVPTASVYLGYESYRNRRSELEATRNQEVVDAINGTSTKELSAVQVTRLFQTLDIDDEMGLDADAAVKLEQTDPGVLEDLGVTPGEVEGAAQSGQDVPVKWSWVNNIKDPELQKKVLRNLRVSLDGKTPEQLQDATLAQMTIEALQLDSARKSTEVEHRTQLGRLKKELRDSGLSKVAAESTVAFWDRFSRRMSLEEGYEMTSLVEKLRARAVDPTEEEKKAKRSAVAEFQKITRPIIDPRTGEQMKDPETGEALTGTREEIVLKVFRGAGTLEALPHETGHIFLQEMFDWSQSGNASEQFLAEMKVIEDWLGADFSKGLTEEQHETFANTMTRYVAEGVAPSQDLQRPFDRFRHWLKEMYKTLLRQDKGLELTDDIRGSFDRMLVAEQQVEEIATYHGLLEMTSEVISLVSATDAEIKGVGAAAQKFRASAISAIMKLRNKDRRARETQAREDATEDVDSRPINVLRKDLAGTPARHVKGATPGKKAFEDGTSPKTRLGLADDVVDEKFKVIEGKYKRSDSPLVRGAALAKAIRTRGYKKYQKALHKFLREKVGKTLRVYTVMSPQQLELFSRGALRGPVSMTLNPNVARAWGDRTAAGTNANAVVVTADMPVNQVAMRGNVENQELVFEPDSVHGKLEIVSKPKGLTALEGVKESPGAERQGVLPPSPPQKINSGLRLDIGEVRAVLGPEAAKALQQKKLAAKTGKRTLTKTAREYGFISDFDMVEALLTTPTRAEQIKDEVQKALDEFDAGVDAQQNALAVDQVLGVLDAWQNIVAGRAGAPKKKALRGFYRAQAATQFGQLPLRHARNPARFNSAMKRAMEKFAVLVKGAKYQQALTELGKIRLNFELHKMSIAMRDKEGRVQRSVAKLVKTDPKRMSEPFLENVKKLAVRFGLVPPTKKNLPSLEPDAQYALSTLVGESAMNEGVDTGPQFGKLFTEEPPPANILNKKGKPHKHFRDLTVEDFENLADLIDHLAHQGRLEVNGKNALSKLKLSELVAQMVEIIKTRPGPLLSVDEDSRMKKLTDIARRYLVENDMTTFLVRKLDAGKFRGLFQTSILEKWFQADSGKLTDVNLVTEASQPFLQHLQQLLADNPGRLMDTEVPRPESFVKARRYWKMLDIIGIAFNMGNTHNRQAIQDGYGLSDGDLQALLSKLSQEDWAAIQGLAAVQQGLWKRQAAVYKALHGITPKQVVGDPFNMLTKDGSAFETDGWYWHLTPDPSLDKRQANEDAELEMQLSSQGMFPLNAVPTGQLQERKDSFGGRPPWLNPFAVMGKSVDHSLTLIHYGEIFRDTIRVLNNSEFRDAVKEAFGGNEVSETLLANFTSVIHKDRQQMGAMGKAFSFISGRVASVFLGFSPAVGVKQPFSVTQYWTHEDGSKVGWMKEFVNIATNPSGAFEAMYILSPYMKDRRNSLETEMKEAQLQAQKGKAVISGSGPVGSLRRLDWNTVNFAFINFFDMFAAAPAWFSTYKQVLAETGDQDMAVLRADTAVRDTQPSGRPIDLSYTQSKRDGIYALATRFGGFRLKFGAIQRQDIDRFRTGDLSGQGLVHNILWNWIGSPLAMHLFMHTVFYGKDLDEFDPKEAIARIGLFNFIGMPLVTEVVSFWAFKHGLAKYPKDPFQFPALKLLLDVTENSFEVVDQLFNLLTGDEVEVEKGTEAVVDLFAFKSGVAVHRVYDAVTEGARQLEEEDAPIWTIFNPDPERRER